MALRVAIGFAAVALTVISANLVTQRSAKAARDQVRQAGGIGGRRHEQQLAGLQLGDALLGTLIAILLLEQVFGYIASFHAPAAQGARR